MTQPIHILGIAGSLRAQSVNRLLLTNAQTLLPSGVSLEIFDLSDVPLFNQDHEQSLPEGVQRLKAALARAHAVLFATPEYNYSIPGVLKNAIDWASRPAGTSAWAGKPAAVIGATPGVLGTARAQYHLRQVLVSLDMPTVNQPEVMITGARDKFSAEGRLNDEKGVQLLDAVLSKLIALTHQQKH